MWYIYTINNNDSVVYVGMSIDPIYRYKVHHYDCMSSIYKLGRYLLSNETTLKLNVIDSNPHKTNALMLERCYIKQYSDVFSLFNNADCCSAMNSIIPSIKNIKNSYLLSLKLVELNKNKHTWEKI